MPAWLGVQLALTAWWRRAGVVPQVVLGQGSGELAAACTAEILTREDALRLLAVAGTGHGPAALDGFQPRPAALPFLSAADGQTACRSRSGPAHWQSCFGPSSGWANAVGSLQQRQVDVCLELGPEALTGKLARRCWPGTVRPVLALASLRPAEADAAAVLTAVGRLYAAGADLVWEHLLPD